jgi:hypothetical protein
MRSRPVLSLAVVATALALWFMPAQEEDGLALSARTRQAATPNPAATGVVPPALRSVSARAGAASARSREGLDVLSVLPRHLDDDLAPYASRLFAVQASSPGTPSDELQLPPKSLPVKALVQAPPLPFQWLGRYEEAGVAAIFLASSDQSFVARVGDAVGENYRLEGIRDTELTLRYLPLNLLQTLKIGEPLDE